MVKHPIGILSLQGAVGPHIEKLEALSLPYRKVLIASDLRDLSGIILPGGESTAMLRLLHKNELFGPLQTFVRTHPAWGICAGAILLADRVTRPGQESLGAIEIEVERNAYGRQVDSFIAALDRTSNSPAGLAFQEEGVFIRAPRIRQLDGKSVSTLLTYREEPVLVEQGRVLVSTFHPELTPDLGIHRYFAEKCRTK